MFEYIVSGLSYTRYTTEFSIKSKLINYYNEVINKINQNDKWQFSSLFNALTEKTIGKTLSDFNGGFNKIYADSGGLQAIMLNKKVTEEFKKNVYKVQSKYADYGMCFDEIPLLVENLSIGSVNNIRSMSTGKYFLSEELKEKAEKTGKNVNNQLRQYAEDGGTCKGFLISQGNTHKEMAEYAHWQFDQIDQELIPLIKGIAISDTCMGNGLLESINMAASYQMYNLPESILSHIHLLGVGRIRRLLPFIELYASGFIPKETTISFDSTTHSNMLMLGKFLEDNLKITRIGRVLNPKNTILFDRIYNKYIKDSPADETRDEFLKVVSDIIGTNNSDNKTIKHLIFVFYIVEGVERFMEGVFKCLEDPNNYYYYLSKDKIGPVHALRDIKTLDDFYEWENTYNQFNIPSRPIARFNYNHKKENILDMF